MEAKDQEQPRRYITFFRQDEPINTSKPWFNSEEVLIPSLGPTHLHLNRTADYSKDKGLLIDAKQARYIPGDMSALAGKYSIAVNIDGLQDTNRNLICHMLYEDQNLELACNLFYIEEEEEDDPFKKFSAMSEKWSDGKRTGLEVFVDPDPQILSKLKFYFETQD